MQFQSSSNVAPRARTFPSSMGSSTSPASAPSVWRRARRRLAKLPTLLLHAPDPRFAHVITQRHHARPPVRQRRFPESLPRGDRPNDDEHTLRTNQT